MTRLLIGFMLGTMLSYVSSVRAQTPATHGHHDLTVRELVEVMAEYDVKHENQQPFFQPAFGLTDFSSTPPSVWIFNTGDMSTRRSTVIHELMHIHCHNVAVECSEEYIRSEEERQVQSLFGALR